MLRSGYTLVVSENTVFSDCVFRPRSQTAFSDRVLRPCSQTAFTDCVLRLVAFSDRVLRLRSQTAFSDWLRSQTCFSRHNVVMVTSGSFGLRDCFDNSLQISVMCRAGENDHHQHCRHDLRHDPRRHSNDVLVIAML